MPTIAELVAEDQAVRSRAFMYGSTGLGGPDFVRPEMRDGRVVLQSLNLSHVAYPVTATEYRKIRRRPLRKIGLWNFTPESDPEADDIEFAHRCPDAAGRELYRLRQDLAAARKKTP